ncbi:lethal(2) giant larvae protein isoform X2 [Lepeophtheirus salmonis]
MVNLRRFNFDEQIIYQDIVIANCNNDDFKINPGPTESIIVDPTNPEKILIGYARGLIVLWDRTTATADQSFVANQQLECLAWRNDGSEFISAHNDGTYIVWSRNKGNEAPNMPYGPYPCKAITRFHWFHQNGTPLMIFSGGMPRASYGDKYTISIMKGESDKHVVFDLTSKIVDFVVIYSDTDNSPLSLFILAEEELVAIDLQNPDFPVFKPPYLNSIHSSAVTCINQLSDVSEDVYSRLESCNEVDKVSKNDWPISGGSCNSIQHHKGRDILLTGHEDGSVKLWSAGGIALTLLGQLNTAKYFSTDDEGNDDGELSERGEEDEEGWPPFRKVGSFDPYSDDPRMAIKKVAMCKNSGRVFIGGTAGQVVICDLVDEDSELNLKVLKADLVTEKEGFTWKGHSSLTLKNNEIKLSKGYQPTSIMQINPPASINSLGFQSSWGIMAVGTAHGLVFMDCVTQTIITSKCTLNAQDIANADDNPMSRRKSLKKSLRESFRRLRKGRSQRNIDKKKIGTVETVRRDLRSDSPESRPIERQVEARSGFDDGLGSMVRCLHFANTYIANGTTLSPTLWAGTNSGQILIFMLTLPKNRKDAKEKASTLLAKEIQLKHRAPVIDIQVLDSSGLPITDESDESIPHRVLIASEEQFKIFLLPTLKPCGKYKLTAHEGSRIRRVGFTSFISKSDDSVKENCFVCLTNLGDIAVHSLPELKRQIQTSCIKKEDVIAISTLVFTSNGEAFYLSSSSEIQRVSVAAAKVMLPNGTISLSSNARMEAPASPPLPASTVNKATDNNNGDVHNETTVSEVSADITLDSVKDHTVISQSMETSINENSRLEQQQQQQSKLSPPLPLLPPPTLIISSTQSNKGELKGLESQVNGVLSDNLDNSVVIEDHLNQMEVQGKMEATVTAGAD